ncbi:RNA-directed DNA polymerase, eukaryota [Tanacetum coccineum]
MTYHASRCKSGGFHVTLVPQLEVDEFRNRKDRMTVYLDELEPFLLEILENGPPESRDTKIVVLGMKKMPLRCLKLKILLKLTRGLLLALVNAQDDQSGFISVGCGIAEGSTYTDNRTGINYVSDAGFIDGVVSREIVHTSNSRTLDLQFTTLTSFPENTRNCYTLRPEKGKGNRSLVPNCLGNPFISALELRLLESSMYATRLESLILFRRINFGTNEIVRYGDDKYDRIWYPINSTGYVQLQTSGIISVGSTTEQVPSKVICGRRVFDSDVRGLANRVSASSLSQLVVVDFDALACEWVDLGYVPCETGQIGICLLLGLMESIADALANLTMIKSFQRFRLEKEVDIGLGGGCDKPLRPADMLLYSWDEGLDVCVDLTGSSPLTQTGMVDIVPGRAVIDAAHRKRVKYEAKCADIGYGFLPLSFSSLGELEKDAVTLLKRIRKFSMTQDIGARAVVHIFNRISFVIAKGVRAQIVSRLLSNFLDHAILCDGIVGIKHRHNIMRDTLVDICYRSGISAGREVDIRLDGGCDKPLRPSDMLLYSWDGGLDVCVDLT